MSRRHELPSSRRHVMIFDDDWQWLEANYGTQSAQPVGVGHAIRALVHVHVKRLRLQVLQRLDAQGEAQRASDG